MIEIEKPKIEFIEQNEEGTYGKFILEPLERGYGITPVSYTHLDVYKRQSLHRKAIAYQIYPMQYKNM